MKFRIILFSSLYALGLLAWGVLGAAQAEFLLVEDFTSLDPGDIHLQNDWHSVGGCGTVAVDPENPANQVLEITANSSYLYKPVLLPGDTDRTFFTRFQIGPQQSFSFGLSDSTSPDQFGHFEVELSMSNASNELRVNNGGIYDVLTTLEPDTWYNLWVVVDNLFDESQIYLHDRDMEPATPADRLEVFGLPLFDFRNGFAGDLRTFFVKTGGGSSENSGPIYFDDLYLEDTSTLNLQNPAARLPGDLNGDGFVGGDDLDLVRAFWGQTVTAGDWTSGDASYDGFVGGDDLDIVRANWGSGNTPNTVPEPSSVFSLLMLGAVVLLLLSRRFATWSLGICRVFDGAAFGEMRAIPLRVPSSRTSTRQFRR